jgi:hypothetical protein
MVASFPQPSPPKEERMSEAPAGGNVELRPQGEGAARYCHRDLLPLPASEARGEGRGEGHQHDGTPGPPGLPGRGASSPQPSPPEEERRSEAAAGGSVELRPTSSPASSAGVPAGKFPDSSTQSSTFEVPSPCLSSLSAGGEGRGEVVSPSSALSPLLSPRAPSPSTLNSQLSTILCLPYQPLDQLAGSLSAADLHVVVMGDAFVGLVHPCKIYNILSVAAPVLYIGPRPSHLSELLNAINHDYPCASAGHGEVDRVLQQIKGIRRQSSLTNRQLPAPTRTLFSKEALLPKLIEELESR